VAGPLPVAAEATHPWDEVARLLMAAVEKEGRQLTIPPGLFWFAGLLSEAGSAVTGKAPAMDRRRARDMSHFSWTCDVAPTIEALDWRPSVDLATGLARTAAWYREIGWL
jgi:nucleoside-diphosphate-sugar epimerase